MPVAHKPTEETKKLVKKFAKANRTNAYIAKRLSIDLKTLAKYYDEIIKYHREDMLDDLEESVYDRAFKDNNLAMFVLKTKRGWSETIHVKVDLPMIRLQVQGKSIINFDDENESESDI